MPHLKCNKCQHEWDSVSSDSQCSWCGSNGKVLEEETSFEKFVKGLKTFFDKVGLKKQFLYILLTVEELDELADKSNF